MKEVESKTFFRVIDIRNNSFWYIYISDYFVKDQWDTLEEVEKALRDTCEYHLEELEHLKIQKYIQITTPIS